MVKIAVIFVLFALFALCSVVVSARITREKPNAFQPSFGGLKRIADSGNSHIPDAQKGITVSQMSDVARKSASRQTKKNYGSVVW